MSEGRASVRGVIIDGGPESRPQLSPGAPNCICSSARYYAVAGFGLFKQGKRIGKVNNALGGEGEEVRLPRLRKEAIRKGINWIGGLAPSIRDTSLLIPCERGGSEQGVQVELENSWAPHCPTLLSRCCILIMHGFV